jgi:hypothetical protein
MAPEVTCPACQYRPPAACGPVCPRCGAGLARTEVRPAAGDVQATRPAPLPTVRCPACGRDVAEVCLLCPYCEEPLAERHRVRRAEDDPQGARRTRALVALVAVAAGVAVTWSLVVLAKAVGQGGGTAGLAVVLGVAILVAAVVVFGVFLPTRFHSPYEEQATVGSTFLAETLGPLGCFALVVLGLLTFIFSVCAAGW